MMILNIRKSVFMLVWFFSSALLHAQTSVLFVGNSYTYYNEMPETFQRMADLNGVDCKIAVSVNGGVSLKDHWESYAGLKTKQLIKKGSFDYVIVQDQSMTPIQNPKQTRYFGKKISQLIKQQGGDMIIFQGWSRKNNPSSQMQLNETFQLLSKETESSMAPIAEVWHLAMKMYPELELYDQDGSHPSEVGSYLSAMVIFKILFGKEDSVIEQTFKSEKLTPSQVSKCLLMVNQVVHK